MNLRSTRTRPIKSRGARIFAVAMLLVASGAATVTFVSGGGRGSAFAEASLEDFVPIEEVEPNVKAPEQQRGGSNRAFTVDCGVNENGKFSPDNPVAQPGIKNGAEHVHDFVGNLAITADSSDEDLEDSGTTCRNGDKSSYFWPVVRIDRSVRAEGDAEAKAKALAATVPAISCPAVRDRLPAVASAAKAQVNRELAALDQQVQAANKKMAATRGRIDPATNNAITSALRAERAATMKRLSAAIGADGRNSGGLVSLVDCEVSYDGVHAEHGAGEHRALAKAGSAANPTVQCPTLRDRLPGVPAQAVAEVNRNLALLDKQISEANERLVTTKGEGGPGFVDNAIMGPLAAKRTATIDRIAIAIGRNAEKPAGLNALAACTLKNGANANANDDQNNNNEGNNGNNNDGNGNGNGDNQGGNNQGDGNNQGGNDQGNGGQGNGDEEEAAELPAPAGPNLELPNNTGGIVRPAQVKIEYRGNPVSEVTAMPRFLRALTGDAKPIARGPANARATWTCSGFADRLSNKYPICPNGSQVMRVHDFPGCWDGQNTDSENHRAHVAFADAGTGACPENFVTIPQLRISISYNIPRDVQERGQFALDSFPEEDHNPFSDHNDFINVNSDQQMAKIVSCINTGRGCR